MNLRLNVLVWSRWSNRS